MSREQIALNEGWNVAATADKRLPASLPADLDWQRQDLPIPIRLDGSFGSGAGAVWLRRTLVHQIPEARRLWVNFRAVWPRGAIFLNGRRLVAGADSFLPLEYDLTDHLSPGQNELALWCGPMLDEPLTPGEVAPLGPAGFGAAPGPWQAAWLELAPAVSISDLAVRTWMRRGLLEAEISIQNRLLVPFEGRLSLSVWEGEREVLSYRPAPVALARGLMDTLRLSLPLPNARPWSPEEPVLYRTHAAIEQGGRIIDSQDLTFGVREVNLERDGLRLNGQQRVLRGGAWNYTDALVPEKKDLLKRFGEFKQAGHNLVRLRGMPFPEAFLDCADEAGVLVVGESALRTNGTPAQGEATWKEICRDHMRGWVRRDRSHPSLAAWALPAGLRGTSLAAEINALDPTRPVLFDGGEFG